MSYTDSLVNSPRQYQDAYTQMLATYELVETAYAQKGLDMPNLQLQDPHELCLVLQRMWHELQR